MRWSKDLWKIFKHEEEDMKLKDATTMKVSMFAVVAFNTEEPDESEIRLFASEADAAKALKELGDEPDDGSAIFRMMEVEVE